MPRSDACGQLTEGAPRASSSQASVFSDVESVCLFGKGRNNYLLICLSSASSVESAIRYYLCLEVPSATPAKALTPIIVQASSG
jgi:hypothetical protein